MKGMTRLKILFPDDLADGMDELIVKNYINESELAQAALRDLFYRENIWPPHKKIVYDPMAEIKKRLIPNYGRIPAQIMLEKEDPTLVVYPLLDDEERGFNTESVVKKLGHNPKNVILISIVRYFTKIGLLGFFEDKLTYDEKLRLYHVLGIAKVKPSDHTYLPPKRE